MSIAKIASVKGRRVWDSRGRPTVEAEVTLASGHIGRAIAPAGASRGGAEAVELRDGGTALGGMGVERAVASVAVCGNALAGHDAADQPAIDLKLIELDGTDDRSRLGANAMVAVSMAVAHAAAASHGVALWRYLAGDNPVRLPLPEVQIFGGGAHAAARVDIQDVMVMPVGATSFDQAMVWCAEVYAAAGRLMSERGALAGVADEGGWWPAFETNEAALEAVVRSIEDAGLTPGLDMAISLDIAATTLVEDGRYRLVRDGRVVDGDGMAAMLLDWSKRYPIRSIEDPLAETDDDGMRRFTAASGAELQIVGDDFLVTNAERVRRAAALGAGNAVLIKPNQAGTLTEAKAALDAAKTASWGTIVSARSGESEDVTIAHLAVGWDAGQLKVGSFARSERMAKWNEVLRIAEALGADARYAGADALP
jgi:enolase